MSVVGDIEWMSDSKGLGMVDDTLVGSVTAEEDIIEWISI